MAGKLATTDATEVRKVAHVKILIETDRLDIIRKIQDSLPECTHMRVLISDNDAPYPSRPRGGTLGSFGMTARQTQILELLVQNLSNKEIGRALSLSHFTVRNHISQILRLLGVPTRGAAIAKSASLFLR